MGKGKEISFWQNVWFENESLKSNVPRLYTLVLAEDENLCLIYKRRGDDGIWNFLIRRGLFAWEEEELQRLNHLLTNGPCTQPVAEMQWHGEQPQMIFPL